MAGIGATVTGVAVIDPERVDVTVRRDDAETTYRFRRVVTPPVSAIDYGIEFQRDFFEQHEAFLAVVEVARRAFHGELPQVPMVLPA